MKQFLSVWVLHMVQHAVDQHLQGELVLAQTEN